MGKGQYGNSKHGKSGRSIKSRLPRCPYCGESVTIEMNGKGPPSTTKCPHCGGWSRVLLNSEQEGGYVLIY